MHSVLPGPGHPSNLHSELLVFDWEYVTKQNVDKFLSFWQQRVGQTELSKFIT